MSARAVKPGLEKCPADHKVAFSFNAALAGELRKLLTREAASLRRQGGRDRLDLAASFEAFAKELAESEAS